MTSELRLLRDLVGLPSVNPAFTSSADSYAGEQCLAEFIAATAAKAGMDVELMTVQPGRPNVIVTLRPRARCRRRLLLVPHLDTVGVDDTNQFAPRIRGGRLHGRGACDTKGSIAAMLSALLRLARQSQSRPAETEIVLAAVVDEENHQAGSRALARSGLKADLAIVGEPTCLEVVTAHKGNLWLQIRSRGKAAHGCCPALGRNAIRSMARVVEALEGPYAEKLKRRQHPLLGHATINVGTIAGGRQPNIVPDQCVISIDRRTLPGESDRAVRHELRMLLKSCDTQARLMPLRTVPCPALETPKDLPWVRELMGVAGQRRPGGADYFCDAAVLASAGIPSVVFGPGDIAQAHTRDEWIAVTQLEQAVRLLGKFLANLP
jgi:acetylornithine deacetylase/succinyl-diaminopimelate desuccinylase family protein